MALKLFSITFMVGIDVLIWVVLRFYAEKGVIVAFPRSIERDRSPRWFRFNMAIGWVSLTLCIGFTAIVSSVLLFTE